VPGLSGADWGCWFWRGKGAGFCAGASVGGDGAGAGETVWVGREEAVLLTGAAGLAGFF